MSDYNAMNLSDTEVAELNDLVESTKDWFLLVSDYEKGMDLRDYLKRLDTIVKSSLRIESLLGDQLPADFSELVFRIKKYHDEAVIALDEFMKVGGKPDNSNVKL